MPEVVVGVARNEENQPVANADVEVVLVGNRSGIVVTKSNEKGEYILSGDALPTHPYFIRYSNATNQKIRDELPAEALISGSTIISEEELNVLSATAAEVQGITEKRKLIAVKTFTPIVKEEPVEEASAITETTAEKNLVADSSLNNIMIAVGILLICFIAVAVVMYSKSKRNRDTS
jgi:hypothetical protein